MNYRVLVVDDEPANTRMLERLLRDQYDVVTAQSGAEALEALNVYDFALIISDQRMPGMTGVEFLKRSAEVRPHCVRIILTGYTDAGDLVDALNSNVVYKYVTKPWVNADLLQTVKRALSHYETIKAQHRLNLENQRLHERASAAEDSIIRLCFELLGMNNEFARKRAPRVREFSLMVGRALKLDTASLETLSGASYLHEIADVYIPTELLHQGGETLSQQDHRLFMESRERGLDLLANLPDSADIIDAIRHLPERFDGTGLPDGLANVQIPLASRIISVARAYDDLLDPDNGFGKLSEENAMAELHAESGTRFDPQIVKAFCALLTVAQMQETSSEDVAVLV